MPIPGSGEEFLRSFRLGDWLVEPRLGQISRDDRTVRLRPRAMEVLVLLAAADGDVVSRRQIIDAVWRTSFVSDNVVSQVVTELRQAFGDDARHPRYIQNVPRRGYRLVARVTDLDEEPPTGGQQPEFALASGHVTHPVGQGETVVGRGSAADIRIDLTEVSRRHARIVVQGSTATIEDLGSKNGTFVNGLRIAEPTRLAEGDEVQFGSAAARFRFARAGEPTQTAQVVL
jgi:DNA-binding winged helix-turn-helix (wHTH) protein